VMLTGITPLRTVGTFSLFLSSTGIQWFCFYVLIHTIDQRSAEIENQGCGFPCYCLPPAQRRAASRHTMYIAPLRGFNPRSRIELCSSEASFT
jgi:hypothetical protein